jgi:hypothetical protein
MSSKLKAVVVVILLGMIAALSIACTEEIGGDNREEAVSFRNRVYEKAVALIPAYEPENFPARRALNEYTIRQDRENHPYFVYILGINGNIINYFVSRTLPVNECAFLSATQDVRDDNDGGNLVLTAPSLDGIFYGGSGASAQCDGVIIFDLASEAMLTVSGPGRIVSDVPLALDLEPVEVQQVDENGVPIVP